MPSKDLQILITAGTDELVVSLAGEVNIDFDTSVQTVDQVLSHKPRSVVVDAANLTFISSVGMCFLINLRKAVRENGGKIALRKLQPMVRKAMEHAHVIHLFDLKNDQS